MPTLDWNKSTWGKEYNWENKGEEWSKSWGNSEAQWFSSIYARIHRFLPCENILEIACGYGRWSKFLIDCTANTFKGIDLSSECIEYCMENFKNDITSFIKNDGLSLNEVSDHKYDFIFSFDSLVHANPDTLNTYINQIVPLLKQNGVCFIHHSNFGTLIESGLADENHLGYVHFRDQKSSAKIVREFVIQNGGKILIQEIIDWGGASHLDCFTLFCKNDSFAGFNEIKLVNEKFMSEAEIIKQTHSLYNKF
jgi:SAM-dependent methyltransferase